MSSVVQFSREDHGNRKQCLEGLKATSNDKSQICVVRMVKCKIEVGRCDVIFERLIGMLITACLKSGESYGFLMILKIRKIQIEIK